MLLIPGSSSWLEVPHCFCFDVGKVQSLSACSVYVACSLGEDMFVRLLPIVPVACKV